GAPRACHERRDRPPPAGSSPRWERNTVSGDNRLVDGDKLASGLDLMRRGEYFEAHEELEIAWRAAPPEERDFLQGLVHVTVAWYQAGRGRPVACASQLEKA